MLAQHPSIEAALSIADAPEAANERDATILQDRPSLFGDDVIDNLQGLYNIARNASTILRAPKLPKITAPAIAIGGGPSLAKHIDRIRDLQDKCLIVAAQTSLQGLLESGITPHLAAPMERPAIMTKYLPPDCGNIAFAGAPLVNHGVMDRFKHHYFVPSADCLYKWTNLPDEFQVFFGSSTGTTAVNVAAAMTHGPVFLVGHDLAYDEGESHWDKSIANKPKRGATPIMVPGNNGATVASEPFWIRLNTQLEETIRLHPGLYNVNAHDGVGAKIGNMKGAPLPDPASLSTFELPHGEPEEGRLIEWAKWARQLPMHARQLDRFYEKAKDLSPDETDILKAGLGKNGYALSYLLVSILTSMSYEARLGELSHKQVLEWLKSAMHNTLYNCRDVFEQIAELAHDSRN